MKFGGMSVSEAKRLRSLGEQNVKLEKLLEKLLLAVATLRQTFARNPTTGSRKHSVNWAIAERCYSQRLAYRLFWIDPRAYRYRSIRVDRARVRKRLREPAAMLQRFGCRRRHDPSRREGREVSRKKLDCLNRTGSRPYIIRL